MNDAFKVRRTQFALHNVDNMNRRFRIEEETDHISNGERCAAEIVARVDDQGIGWGHQSHGLIRPPFELFFGGKAIQYNIAYIALKPVGLDKSGQALRR